MATFQHVMQLWLQALHVQHRVLFFFYFEEHEGNYKNISEFLSHKSQPNGN